MSTDLHAAAGRRDRRTVLMDRFLHPAVLLVLSSCNSGHYVPPTVRIEPSETAATVAPSATTATVAPPAAMDSFAPQPTLLAAQRGSSDVHRTEYTLSGWLDYDRHYLQATETVTYANQATEPLSELVLVVEPNRQPGVFRLIGLQWADGQSVAQYRLEGARLRLLLREPLLPGASLNVGLAFELRLPAQSGPLGHTARQTNLGDWHPFVPPYRMGQGWLIHDPAEVGEHLVYDVADYDVELQLVGATTNLVMAASAPAELAGTHYRYRLEAARSFVFSVSPEYRVLSTSVDAVAISSYAFPEHAVAGDAALKTTAAALALFGERFGSYRHASLAIVEAGFPDGLEYDGFYFLATDYYAAYDGGPQNYLTALAAHETAHQWWYGLVGNDQAMEPWLDEALATYSERLFFDAEYPELVDWWWAFRVKRFNPRGSVGSTIYDHSSFRSYVNAVYLRGALFFEELRHQLGDRAFFAFLRAYALYNAQGQATTQDFMAILVLQW